MSGESLPEIEVSATGLSRNLRDAADHLDALLALRPPCPTCDGTRCLVRDYWSKDADECPDCIDGKVSIEQLVATYNAVWDDEFVPYNAAIRLRAVRP